MKRLSAAFLAICLLCPVCRAAEPVSVSAVSAILVDAESGRVLYEKNTHAKRLIASITKLMTALVAVESTPNLDCVIPIKAEYQAEGSSMYLRPGEEITLEGLLYGLLLSSGNDAALAIADGCAGKVDTFVEWMNRRAADLGMKDTHFANPNGLDAEDHYSTAADMVLLAKAVLANETLAKIVATRSATIAGRSLTNHNKLLWRYEGCTGMKTGYTDAAGRTLVSSAYRDGQTLICVTLKAPDDWDDHVKLFDYGFAAFPRHPLARSGKVFRSIHVMGSLLSRVEVETATDVAYPLTADERVRARITLPDRVAAPVKKGAITGKLTFLVGEKIVGETYLLYTSDVPENIPQPNLFQRITQFLHGGEDSSLAVLLTETR